MLNGNSNSHVPEKLEIVLDVLDPPLFAKIAQYASEKATIRKRGLVGLSSDRDIVLKDVTGKRRRR